jgi:hypothetical protein
LSAILPSYPAAYIFQFGEVDARIACVAVLDGLYGDLDKFVAWIERRGGAFLFSAYGASSRAGNADVARKLSERGIEPAMRLPRQWAGGSVTFLDVRSPDVTHADFATRAWTALPVKDLRARIPGFPRR